MTITQQPIAIPEPEASVDSLWRSVKALKEAVEVLQGITGNRPAATLDELNKAIANLQTQIDALP